MSRLNRLIQHGRTFSPLFVYIECLNSLDYQLFKRAGKPLSSCLHQQRNQYVLHWLTAYLQPLIKSYQCRTSTKATLPGDTIWMCWLQGEEKAPEFVRRIISNVRAHAGGRHVRVLSEQTIPQYCDLPRYIMDKYRNGIITPQQLTDIVRVDLLSRHGGLWIDATVLICQDIPQYVFDLQFFSVKGLNGDYPSARLVVDGTQWESYCIASRPHSIISMFLREALIEYWRNMNTLIDYFLIFYLAKIAREQIPAAAAEYNSIPNNNQQCELLDPFLLQGLPFCSTDWRRFFASPTFAYKLSWKYHYPTKTKQKEPTLAAYLPWSEVA